VLQKLKLGGCLHRRVDYQAELELLLVQELELPLEEEYSDMHTFDHNVQLEHKCFMLVPLQ